MTDKTHFGYKTVEMEEKQHLVDDVFHSVAQKYDLMNDVLSMGLHRIWKREALSHLKLRGNLKILDLASGTGDIAALIHRATKGQSEITMTDINESMLNVGRKRLIDKGIINNIEFMKVDAQNCPFEDNTFDRICIAFGLRNVPDKPRALKEMARVLKPGGIAVIVEFSKPFVPGFSSIYDWYSFNIMPKLGKWIAKDEESYRYLAESIRMHPNQEELKSMMLDAGFDEVKVQNLSGGILAIHSGFKY